MIKKVLYILSMILPVVLTGCIHNDLPYPRIPQNITAITPVGQRSQSQIDSTALTATIYLTEEVDIQKVTFSDFQVTPGAEVSPNLSEGAYDLSSPLTVTLSKYQTYEWIVKAEQEIERYFAVEGEIGEATVDAVAHRVVLQVPYSMDITSVKVTAIKLGPAGHTTLSPEIIEGNSYDFSQPFPVEVISWGRPESWTIYVERVEQNVSTDNAEAWSKVVWVYGSCEAEKGGSFQYKNSDSEEWLEIEEEWLTQNGGNLSCFIPHLEPLTSYDVRAYSGNEYANVLTVTTEDTMILPDGSFDQWWLKDGKVWCPWNEGGTPYWDTGNTGAATLGQSNVLPTDHTVTGTGQAAELNTKFVGIFGIGKLGAGSIYTGSFKKVDGTNGILDFGRPFTLRPTKLRGYYQYRTANIDYTNSEWEKLKGVPDTCHIYIALTDWTAPYEIRTNPNNRQLFNKDADYVIAYGELLYSGTMDDYSPFEIDLEYKDYFTTPTYLQITCAASKYGDYFTGANGAVLYVDEFSLDYDY
ncbi:MAG: PCMD domain-containing protein [Muribaculaceae bacterium]|nr:PCMD domain-containing protein [Muribaculaceae bacterium]